ncbi:TolC family protein [Flavobacterium lacus]|uniref:Outer membrane protein TolC n=1 Tax=Flavobacterium lacus TaxID=1353778 RepID=A0A328WTL6_9FLAO|nr:TolC family protein [Flavobacterium lacus]RAR47797.1 outer membrane protein TolC [Flavobacterium lacus]
MKSILPFILLFSLLSWSQNMTNDSILTLDSYLGYVKQFHPLVKQANLEVSQAQAGIIAARGGFDPKIEIDYENKQFKSTEYYDLLNTTFKIPTWYGIEIKAGFDQMEGTFLNPQNNTPTNGLAMAGISVPIGQGLLINNRMADLKKAKIYTNLSQAERDLEVANVLYAAANSYFNWYRNYNEYKLYETFLKNSEVRFNGIRGLIAAGDRPAIDSIEAGILVKSRKLSLEQSRLKLLKSKLDLSNYLWFENNLPLELQEGISPETELDKKVENTLKTNGLLLADIDFQNHPKIRSLQNKVSILEVDKRLKGDLLKPTINLNYNYLSEPEFVRDFNTVNYKYGVNFSFPLFLRKERGNFKVAKLKLQDAELDLQFENQVLKNKIDYQLEEIKSLKGQIEITNELVNDFSTMLNAEERMFFFGESSLFLINTRENSLLSTSLQQIDVEFRFFVANSDLFKLIANPQFNE